MQTAAISYRVADFLKQHAPFQSMEESDLLALAAQGRVRFHESDEYMYWQAKPHGPFVFVIQRGTVSLWEAADGGERMRDIRGEGEMLGIDRFLGSPASLYSAKTCSDVVVYALKAADFEPLLEKYPHAARYLASHATVNADYQQAERRRGAHQLLLQDVTELRPPLTCIEEDTVREAARRISAAGAEAIAVVDGDHGLAGMLTSAGVLRYIAAGGDVAGSVKLAMDREPRQLPPDATVSQCVMAMADTGLHEAGIVAPGGRLIGVVSAHDLAPAFQDEPVAILRAIPHAPDTAALRRLHLRARAFLLDQLAAASAVDWLAQYAHRLDVCLLKRVIELAGAPSADGCWCFYGAAGRGESLTVAAPAIAVIAVGQVSDLPVRIMDLQVESGYLPGDPPRIATLPEWKTQFRRWVEDPVWSQMYRNRPLFDLRPVLGAFELWGEVEAEVVAAVGASPHFVQVLANDCLANLPPMTLFQDLVVEESGERSDLFQIERSALQPLVDVGRVFGMAAGWALGGGTLDRFAAARSLMPDRDVVFREAAEAFRVVLYHQARAGIRQGTDGSELAPALLSGHDRQVLKSCFRSILRLVEFTAECPWMEGA